MHDPECTPQLWKLADGEGLYLNPRQRQRLKTVPSKPSRITKVNILRQMQPWEFQWQIRRILPGDKIGFDPFPSLSIAKTADKLGTSSGRTKTAPVDQTMFLIDRSIRWILDYSSAVQEMAQRADMIATEFSRSVRLRDKTKKLGRVFDNLPLPQGPGQPWPVRPRLISAISYHGGMTEVLRCFFASCFIVIAAFTARRRKEVTSCRAAGVDNQYCITSDEDGHWIELWIEKTTRGWDKTPCPEIVVKAIELLRQLSESARNINGTPQLFQYKLWGRSKTASFRILKALRELTGRLDIPPLPDGSTWKFHPHQFRRFFAIMYIWRYEFGELSALSYQLRHYNLDITRRYLTEPIHGKIFREVQSEHTVSILKEVAVGRRDAGGPFGERFKKLAGRIRAQMIASVHIFTEEKFASQIERLVLRSGKILKGFPWGYCTCGSSSRDLSQAKCVQSDSGVALRGPDESKATLTTCATCPHHLTHEGFRPYLANQIELHEKASRDKNNGPLVRNASATYLSDLRNYCDRLFGPSENGRLSNAQTAESASAEGRSPKPGRGSAKNRCQNSGTSTIRKKRNTKRGVRAKVARTVSRLG
jgi:integrase